MDTAGNMNYIYLTKNVQAFIMFNTFYKAYFSYAQISRVLQINLGAIDLPDENLYTAGEIYDWEISFLRPGNSVTNK